MQLMWQILTSLCLKGFLAYISLLKKMWHCPLLTSMKWQPHDQFLVSAKACKKVKELSWSCLLIAFLLHCISDQQLFLILVVTSVFLQSIFLLSSFFFLSLNVFLFLLFETWLLFETCETFLTLKSTYSYSYLITFSSTDRYLFPCFVCFILVGCFLRKCRP